MSMDQRICACHSSYMTVIPQISVIIHAPRLILIRQIIAFFSRLNRLDHHLTDGELLRALDFLEVLDRFSRCVVGPLQSGRGQPVPPDRAFQHSDAIAFSVGSIMATLIVRLFLVYLLDLVQIFLDCHCGSPPSQSMITFAL